MSPHQRASSPVGSGWKSRPMRSGRVTAPGSGDGGQVPSSAVWACQAGRPHQPGDTAAPARGAVAPKSGVDAWRTVGSPRPGVDGGDLPGQLGVADRAGAGRAGTAGVVGGSGDLK